MLKKFIPAETAVSMINDLLTEDFKNALIDGFIEKLNTELNESFNAVETTETEYKSVIISQEPKTQNLAGLLCVIANENNTPQVKKIIAGANLSNFFRSQNLDFIKTYLHKKLEDFYNES